MVTAPRALNSPPPRQLPRPLPRPLPPRGLIFLAAGWLVASWLLSIGVRPPVQAHAASYTPGVRLMCLSLVIGICVAWPLVRLSGPGRAWPIRQALLDLAVLLSLAQVVVWPLRLVTPWVPLRSAALDLCLTGWAVAAAALVVMGTIPVERGAGARRTAAMLGILVFVAAVPVASLLFGGPLPFSPQDPSSLSDSWWNTASWSPLSAVHALSAPNPKPPSEAEWRLALVGWWVAVPSWVAAGLAVLFVRADHPNWSSPSP